MSEHGLNPLPLEDSCCFSLHHGFSLGSCTAVEICVACPAVACGSVVGLISGGKQGKVGGYRGDHEGGEGRVLWRGKE